MPILKLFTFGLIIAFLVAPSSGGVARNPGLLFVSSERTDSVVIVDPEIKRTKYLKTSRRPCDIHFSGDHTYLYVACDGDDAIDIIEVAKLEVVGRLDAGSNPRAFAVSEKQHRIYLPNRVEPSLPVIDLEQNVIIGEVPTGAGPQNVFVSEGGHIIYVDS